MNTHAHSSFAVSGQHVPSDAFRLNRGWMAQQQRDGGHFAPFITRYLPLLLVATFDVGCGFEVLKLTMVSFDSARKGKNMFVRFIGSDNM